MSVTRRDVTVALGAGAAGLLVGAREPTMADRVRRIDGFDLGVAVAPGDLARRRGAILDTFTSLTAENAMKWRVVEPRPGTRDFDAADRLVAFAESEGLRVRGHTLLWSRLNGAPKWLEAAVQSAPSAARALRGHTLAHARAMVGRYAGRIAQWDVVNEPLALREASLDRRNIFVRLGGEALLRDAFVVSAAADPSAALFVNELNLERSERRFDAFRAVVDRLRAAGAPIHGVGLQGHFFRRAPDPVRLATRLERIAAMGLIAEITELDLPLRLFRAARDPLAAQADAFAAVMDVCLSARACRGVTVWGIDDSRSWMGPRARPLPFDEAGRPKPALRAIRSALGRAQRDRASAM